MPTGLTPTTPAQPWTDAELLAAASAYIFMLRQELNGGTYVKAEINRQLRSGPLSGRNSSSVELRMQNISAVLLDLRLPILRGYVPAVNIGSGVIKRLKLALSEAGVEEFKDFTRTANPHELEARTTALLKASSLPRPAGTAQPEQTQITTTAFIRDPAVKAWVLKNAEGCCEGCMNKAPFQTMTGESYLEVHHVVPLASKGSDTISNAVALCPNCHRLCHFGIDRDAFKLSLYERIRRLQIEIPAEHTQAMSEFIETHSYPT